MRHDIFNETVKPKMPDEAVKKQPIVKLDVGGKIFRTLRSTLERFPQSLLAQMVDQFPELVESGEPLFIDRSPDGFEVILEIYRRGRCRRAISNMSADDLQDDLDFYQLPSGIKLGLDVHNDTKFSTEEYGRDLASRIAKEIKICRMEGFFPWRVNIYYKLCGGKADTEPNVYIEPPCGMDDMEYISSRGHTEFMRARKLHNDINVCTRQRLDHKLRISPVDGITQFVCRDVYHVGNYVKNTVAQQDLDVYFGKEETDEWPDDLKIECLTIVCKK